MFRFENLEIWKKSIEITDFENANMIMLFEKLSHLRNKLKQEILSELEELCRKINNFIKTLSS
jgi:hypothetical protein